MRHPCSRSHDPNTRPTEGGGALGGLGVPQGECADTRGAEALRRSAAEAKRSQDYRHAKPLTYSVIQFKGGIKWLSKIRRKRKRSFARPPRGAPRVRRAAAILTAEALALCFLPRSGPPAQCPFPG